MATYLISNRREGTCGAVAVEAGRSGQAKKVALESWGWQKVQVWQHFTRWRAPSTEARKNGSDGRVVESWELVIDDFSGAVGGG